MDGLLGIGSAGGSKNKNEGKMLAQRLDVMRRERDARSKANGKTPSVAATAPKSPVMAGAGGGQEMGMERSGSPSTAFSSLDDSGGVVELTGSSGGQGGGRAGGGGNPRRPKNKKNKKKNKK